jgi:hypothetical protein
MIIVLCNHEVLVSGGIPPLSPHPPDFLNDNPPISPTLKTSLPDDITCNSERIWWETILDWYAGSSQSIHLGVSVYNWNLNHDVKIVIKPDLSDISLYVINTRQLTPDFYTILDPQYHIFEDHTHVSEVDVLKNRIYIRSTSSPPNVISPESPIFLKLSLPGLGALDISTSCPASGRFVYCPRNDYLEIVVVDFLKYYV